MERPAREGFVVRVGVAVRALGMLMGGLGLLGLLAATVGALFFGVERFPSPLGEGRVDYATCAAQLALLAASGGGIAAIGRRLAWKHLQRTSGVDAHLSLLRLLEFVAHPHRAARESAPTSSVATTGGARRRRGGGRRWRGRRRSPLDS